MGVIWSDVVWRNWNLGDCDCDWDCMAVNADAVEYYIGGGQGRGLMIPQPTSFNALATKRSKLWSVGQSAPWQASVPELWDA